MRQIFSIRFFAAIGAVIALALLWSAVFRDDDPVSRAIDFGPDQRRIDLVDVVLRTERRGFSVGDDGLVDGEIDLVLDSERVVRVVEDTPGEVECGRIAEVARCAVVADLLGNGVVWFSIVPVAGRTVRMPAIVALADGLATLSNGWQVPFAPILDRRCGDTEFESFSEFRRVRGRAFVSLYDIDEQQLTAVQCVAPDAPEPAPPSGPR